MAVPAPRRAKGTPKTPASILTALDDPEIFGTQFGGPTWAAWRALIMGLFGLGQQMTQEEAALFRRHTGRTTLPVQPFRAVALVCGRRGGKSRVLALVAVFLACFRDYSSLVAPGETPVIAIIARDREQGKVILGYVRGIVRAVPMLAPLLADDLAESLGLTNGVSVEIHSGSIGAPRGRTYAAVLCDEIAFWRSDESRNPDRDVIRAVRPGLATIPGSLLLMASSPYARRGVLFEAFERHYGKDDAAMLVWRGTTAEMNPSIDAAFIAAAREEDPASASAEYDAEFRLDVATLVPREVVDACVMPNVQEMPAADHVEYHGFVDPSGGSADPMTLAIAHQDDQGKAVLDLLREVRPPFRPEEAVQDFAETLRAYGVTTVHGDRFGGEWPAEAFARARLKYELAERTKTEIYREMLPLLTGRKCLLLDDAKLIFQLCALERRTARGGRDSIDHPRGAHDDVANAAAGALLMAAKNKAFEATARLFAWRPEWGPET